MALMFMVAIVFMHLLGRLPQVWVFIYIGLSIITFVIYAWDKSRAKRNAWRVKESTLHMVALVGGWPGAALQRST